MIRALIDDILGLVVDEASANFGDSLKAIIHYGSSVSQIKSVSDIDLIFVFSTHTKPKSEAFDFLDVVVEPQLRLIEKEGFHYHLSINPVLEQNLDSTQSFYFDLLDRSRILLDRGKGFSSFLKQVEAHMRQNRFERIQQGSRWYWRKGE